MQKTSRDKLFTLTMVIMLRDEAIPEEIFDYDLSRHQITVITELCLPKDNNKVDHDCFSVLYSSQMLILSRRLLHQFLYGESRDCKITCQ